MSTMFEGTRAERVATRLVSELCAKWDGTAVPHDDGTRVVGKEGRVVLVSVPKHSPDCTCGENMVLVHLFVMANIQEMAYTPLGPMPTGEIEEQEIELAQVALELDGRGVMFAPNPQLSTPLAISWDTLDMFKTAVQETL